MDSQNTRGEYNMMGAQKTDEYEPMDSQKTREHNLLDGWPENYAYEMTDAEKTREYELKGAEKTDAYEMTDAEKTREYELKGAEKTDAYEPMGAQNVGVDKSEKSCLQTKKVQYPCVQKSSCVGVWKIDGVGIIHNNQRSRTCQDVDVKPIVRDQMTLVPHDLSEFEKQKHHLTHIPFAHHALKAKHKRNHTNEQSASSKTANSQ